MLDKATSERSFKQAKVRILLLAIIIAIGLSAGISRLFYLQAFKNNDLSKIAVRQHQKTVALEPLRGTIYDRKGRVLAVNLDVESVYAVPSEIENTYEAARRLSKLLNEDFRVIERKLKSDKGFVWIARKLDPNISARIKNEDLEGIGFIKESKRFYPKKELFGQLIGFAGLDNTGLSGIEARYDEFLKGEDGFIILERDARGSHIFPSSGYKPPVKGRDIILTIDEGIQYICERELDKAIQKTRAKSGMIIGMDPKTGEMLAMAVKPSFNPNEFIKYAPEEWRNRIVSDPYEPGSTLKVIVASAALEDKVASPSEPMFFGEDKIDIDGEIIHDTVKEKGRLSFRDVIKRSSNVGAVRIGMRLGKERLYSHLKSFGFGERTDIDISGESKGILRQTREWSKRSIGSVSLGQEIGVTPIQLITAFSAVANNGWMMKPFVVSEIRDGDKIVRKVYPEIKKRVISAETAAEMTRILTSVVEGGTGERAAIEGYRVAGKTGTAQKIDPKTGLYSDKYFVSSFIGYAPAEDPQIALLVVIDSPEGIAWGGSIAAPVFKSVAEDVLLYMNAPSTNEERILMVKRE
ncbi:MAG: penicillin-binding protein 2 [Nitrospirota bacterium]